MADDPVTEARGLIEQSRRELIEELRGLLEKDRAQADRIDSALLTLNAGALLLSITFVGTLTTSKLWLSLLFLAWAAFIASMISVIVAMMRAQRQSHQSAVDAATNLEKFSEMNFVEAGQQRVRFSVGTQKTVAALNVLAFIAFIIGVGFLCTFVGINLSRDTRPVRQSRQPLTPGFIATSLRDSDAYRHRVAHRRGHLGRKRSSSLEANFRLILARR